MKFIVGYPHNLNADFVDCVIENASKISEVYFSWADTPSGRSTAGVEQTISLDERKKKQEQDLKRISDAGVSLNLLFNANCYGKDSQSREFFNSVGDLTDHIKSNFNLGSITTSSPLIAKFIKTNFPELEVRASVNMEIGSIEGISYIKEFFDGFYAKRELNRNFTELRRLKAWCDDNGKTLYLLANSGCLNYCSAHTFHDNLVAHEAEISKMDNGYQFRGVCWDFLSSKENQKAWLERTNFIRPEDIDLYEEFTPAVKLATRVNSSPRRVIEAYLKKSYRGSIMELLEPNHSGVFYPDYIENKNFDERFALTVGSCDKQCEKCGYCKSVLKKAIVYLGEDITKKQ